LRRIVSGIVLALFLTSVLSLAFNIHLVKASGAIYIRADGSIDPPDAPISTTDNITYTFTYNVYEPVVIQRSNILVDGNGWMLQTSELNSPYAGFNLTNVNHVEIKNTVIQGFCYGVYLCYSSFNTISSNVIAGSGGSDINLRVYSNCNLILSNKISSAGHSGICITDSSNNSVIENDIWNNANYGIWLQFSSSNIISRNNIRENGVDGMSLDYYSNFTAIHDNNFTRNKEYALSFFCSCYNGTFYHNNFIDNSLSPQVHDYWAGSYPPSISLWDDGYPSGGNYWSDYSGTDVYSGPYQNETGFDGIGDTPYVIDSNNTDHYPLVKAWGLEIDWWPMFQHDPEHTGHSMEDGPDTNRTLWIYQTGGDVVSSPAVVDGRVFVGSWDWNFYCLDYATGAELWKVNIGGWPYSSSPAVANGIVYVGSMQQYSSNIFALNATTGSVIWARYFDFQQRSDMNFFNGILYVGTRGGLYALNATTGDTIWIAPIGNAFWGSPTLSKGLLYVAYSANVTALNATDGTIVWTNDLNVGPSLDDISPTVAYGMIFIAHEQLGVLALNATNGELIWSSLGPVFNSYSTPAVSDGKLFVTKWGTPSIFALNATTGEVIWNSTLFPDIVSSPAIADGKVFFGSRDGKICALNETNGEMCWTYYTGTEIALSSPAIVDGKLYIGSLDGKVYAFGLNHDVAVENVTTSKTGCLPMPTVCQGYNTTINVSVANLGDAAEVFALTIYANTTPIASQIVSLANEESTILSFTWNTSGFAMGNYTIFAYAGIVPGEIQIKDNNFSECWVFVTLPGDVNGDFKVNLDDITSLLDGFGSTLSSDGWYRHKSQCIFCPHCPNLDIDLDDKIALSDITTCLDNFGKTYP
jgi:parallel beta-helix repeat protein